MKREVKPPRGLSRLMWRFPIWFFRLRMGWMFGKRMLLLNHRGRKSGLLRQAVLEVIEHDTESGSYLLASGFGKNSDWYQNILNTPQVSVQVGLKKIQALALPLDPDASGQALVRYGRRHPQAVRTLARWIGYELDGTEDQLAELGRDHIPVVSIQPAD